MGDGEVAIVQIPVTQILLCGQSPRLRFFAAAVSGTLHWRVSRDLILSFACRCELSVCNNNTKRMEQIINNTTSATVWSTTGWQGDVHTATCLRWIAIMLIHSIIVRHSQSLSAISVELPMGVSLIFVLMKTFSLK